jgi:hypothetical protein
MKVDGAGTHGSASATAHRRDAVRVRYTPDTFHRVIRAMLATSGLSEAELSVLAGLHRDVGKIFAGSTGWPTLPTWCRLAEAAGWSREFLVLEIDKAGLVLTALRREQGWRPPQIKLQEAML